MGARWYDPVIGRWISPDTIIPEAGNPQAFNRFSYCVGNPLRYVDPSGHSLIESEEDGPRTLPIELEAHLVLATNKAGHDNQNTYNLLIYRAAREAGISPKLLKAVVGGETGGKFADPHTKGAVGLMQLTEEVSTSDDRYDTYRNLVIGAEWLRKQYDDLPENITGEERWKLAVLRYTAGEGAVEHAQKIVLSAPSDSSWYGRDPNTFIGLTRRDTAGRCPLSVSIEVKYDKVRTIANPDARVQAADGIANSKRRYVFDVVIWMQEMMK